MCRRQRSGGTDGSNPVPSSGESANSRSQRDQDQPMLAAIGLIETRIRHDVRLRTSPRVVCVKFSKLGMASERG
jgi:hypothetical protein